MHYEYTALFDCSSTVTIVDTSKQHFRLLLVNKDRYFNVHDNPSKKLLSPFILRIVDCNQLHSPFIFS